MSTEADEKMIATEAAALFAKMQAKGDPSTLRDCENFLRAWLNMPSPALQEARAVALEVNAELKKLLAETLNGAQS